jgi:hypothetical protein
VEEANHDLLGACVILDLDDLARQCMAARQLLGKPTARWTARCLASVVNLAVVTRGWPPASMEHALLAVARDPESRSPARVAEAGPWWDTPTPGFDQAIDAHELTEMEARLAETDGLRPALQAQARAELTAEGMPVIRSTVARRACAILDLHQLAMNAERPTPTASPQRNRLVQDHPGRSAPGPGWTMA